jgi:hypothetical protein
MTPPATDFVEPFAGVIIHAAGFHHAEDALDVFAAERLFPGERIDSAIGEGGGHDREVAAGDGDRALFEVKFHHRDGIAIEDVEVPQHVSDGAVAMACLVFGIEHCLVQSEGTSGVGAEGFQEAFDPDIRPAADEAGGGDGAGVDHGIARTTGAGFEADGIEGVARGFRADFLEHSAPAVILQRHAIHERFGDGLDSEMLLGVADFIDSAAGCHQADAEPIGIGLGQFGYICRDISVGYGSAFPVQALEIIEHRRGQECVRVEIHGSRCVFIE